ncbi:unnamed protein product (macronuclear) [Paramecium tetraurelia]|uniref:Uncharacterized protein n=1 Tax=Paramecium tetraurelia TaxID=5888 RepID=A0C7R5_PARTE|nr:uncharacterized protein GSPATT00035963001 [Paramecium tetraurelia]CAK66832.1 unnamed protein product [Paramecium tetraurelia]|eukprot:XP_001434229.1 hypothetical protein (macronuclear) [Paramecium tetraurelia strain d4-2]
MHQLGKSGKSKSFKDYSILKKVQSLSRHDDTDTDKTSLLKQKSFDLTTRRNSSILAQALVYESSQIHRITYIQDPNQYIGMNLLQQKIWERIQKCSQKYIDDQSNLSIIVLKPDQEYEFVFNISKMSCFSKIKQLTKSLSSHFYGLTKIQLQDPYLSMLIGKIKTQKLDNDMRLFELLNIIMNGKKLLVLQCNMYSEI